MSKFFEALREGIEDAISYKKGKATLRSEVIEVPEPPRSYKAKDIKKIRESLNCSQAVFALFLNVSIKTVQAWEAGIRSPNHAALRLLEIVELGIYTPRISQSKSKKIAA